MSCSTVIPIEKLDYEYIGRLADSTELEKILRVLRSKSEGYYPELIQFTENRLQLVKPSSKLLIKSQKVKRANELPRDEWKELTKDFDQWEVVMNQRDSHLSSNEDNNERKLPPVRNPVTIESNQKKDNVEPQSDRSTQIKSTDFAAWDKYDVEKESKLTKEREKSQEKVTKQIPPVNKSGMSLTKPEKEQYSIREKEKGNEEFQSGDYQKALAHYKASIEYFPSAAAYNNAALACNKLGLYSEAVDNCQEVLKLEANNTKALLRRANAYFFLKQMSAALTDLNTLLQLEPGNKRAQELKTKVEITKPLPKDSVTDSIGLKKGKRLVIEEVEEEETIESKQVSTEPPTVQLSDVNVQTSSPPPPPSPLPPNIQKLKDEGNSLFRCGQYGSAVESYTKCIKLLEAEKGSHTSSLAIIYSNRAACHFKNGDCRSCIDDATFSIRLSPVNLKSFMRRAQAYETMEKYKQAYCDYQIALKIDSRVDKAREASSRIAFLLRDMHGNNWKDLLPVSDDTNRVTTAMSSVVTAIPSVFHQMSSSTTSEEPSPSPSVTVNKTERYFDDTKVKGNALVKEGNYKAACSCYTYCISLCPCEVAPYTNRALCFLKLNDFTSAEDDCSKALELNPNSPKALYRRALARKNLKKFNEALKDLRTLIAIDSDNTAAVKEEKLVHDLYLKELRDLQNSTSPKKPSVVKSSEQWPTQSSKKKKVVIEEINEESSHDAAKESVTLTETKSPKVPVEKESITSMKQEKLSINQYIQIWNTLTKSSSSYDYAVALWKIPSHLLPQVITNKLEGYSLSGVISAVEEVILCEGLYEVAHCIMTSLIGVQRFSTILMFLQSKDKQIINAIKAIHIPKEICLGTGVPRHSLRKIFSVLEESGISNLEELKSKYLLK